MTRQLLVPQAISNALWLTVFLQPRDIGLTLDELVEVLGRVGFERGEVLDGTKDYQRKLGPGSRLMPRDDTSNSMILSLYDDDLRDPQAFDYVLEHLRLLARKVTRGAAAASRDHIVAAGTATGLDSTAVDAAITTQLISANLVEQDGLVRLSPRGERWGSAVQAARQRKEPARRQYKELVEAVRDVMARRTDGRPKYAEPIKAFEDVLEDLDYGRFRMWWAQTATDLRMANEAYSATTVCVMAAALAEAALIFIVKRARDLNVGTLASATFKSESPRQWSFDDLLKGAAAGQQDAVFNHAVRDRADRLNRIRQRIHAGRLLADIPTGPIPDLRPEEAREARETLDTVLRAILDWLEKHPKPAT